MTRYRSSPTCSKCWQVGHTKRACPAYRKKAATWLKENEHLKDTEGYHKPHYVREVEGYAESVKNRRCSWCQEKGHNKRSCTIRKGAATKNVEKNKEWRAVVFEKLKEVGLGVGALITSTTYRGDVPQLYLVTDMKWDGINIRASGNECVDYYEYSKHNYKEGSAYPQMTVSSIDNCRSSTLYYPQFKDKDDNELFYNANSGLEIVSPSEPSPPDDWLNDETWAKELF
jgi:hypothetical protein